MILIIVYQHALVVVLTIVANKVDRFTEVPQNLAPIGPIVIYVDCVSQILHNLAQ